MLGRKAWCLWAAVYSAAFNLLLGRRFWATGAGVLKSHSD
jgi:hypothetical protein